MIDDNNIKSYNINDDFDKLAMSIDNFNYNKKNVIRCKLWIDGFHVSNYSRQVNGSYVKQFILYFFVFLWLLKFILYFFVFMITIL